MLNLKWQYKLFLLTAFLGIVPALFISIQFIGITESELTSRVNYELINATDDLSNDVNSFFIDNFKNQSLLIKSIENNDLGPDEKISVMMANVEEIEQILSIGLLFENENSTFDMGIQVNDEELDNLIEEYGIGKEIIYGNLPENYEFGEGDEFELSPIKYIKEFDYWIVHFVVPVTLPEAPRAYLLTTVKLNELRNRILRDEFNDLGSIYILNQRGQFMLTDSTELSHSNFVIRDALRLLQGTSRITEVTNYTEGGEKLVVSFAYPLNLDWVVIAELNAKDAYAAVSEMRDVLFIWLVVGIGLALVAVILFTRIIRRPISQLEATANEISGGNFDIQVAYRPNDPIGTLGNTLVGMSRSLKDSFSKIEDQNKQLEDYSRSLEDKVAERTQELKKTNEDLQNAYLQVLDLNKEKSEFLGIAAHDLKNPLGAIKGYGDLILEDKKIQRKELEKYVTQIVESSRRMFSIISSLLNINKLEEGHIKVNVEEINLKVVISEVLLVNTKNADKKNIKINVEHSEKQILFTSDEVILSQIIDNILSNAIKFSEPEKEVFVKYGLIDSKIFVKIRDQGPGFTENDKKKLFSKFAKLTARPTGGEHSTGLGLSIVKKLVEMLGGTIFVESEAGKGAEFTLEFDLEIKL